MSDTDEVKSLRADVERLEGEMREAELIFLQYFRCMADMRDTLSDIIDMAYEQSPLNQEHVVMRAQAAIDRYSKMRSIEERKRIEANLKAHYESEIRDLTSKLSVARNNNSMLRDSLTKHMGYKEQHDRLKDLAGDMFVALGMGPSDL